MSKTYWYQIDRRQGSGVLDGYDMVKAANFEAALRNYLGEDYDDYAISQSRINGKIIVTARCPRETSAYLEVQRVRRILRTGKTLEQKRNTINEILQQNGFDLDRVDAEYWPEVQCDEFLSDIKTGLKEVQEYIDGLEE